MKATHLLYGVLALAVAVWLTSSFSSDRRRIERQLGQLRALIEKDGDESAVAMANGARRVGNLLSRDFTVHLEPLGEATGDRARISQLVLAYRSRADRIGLDFRDRELQIDGERKIAGMTLLAAVSGAAEGSSFNERYRLRLRWLEEEGEWRIQRVDLLEVLEGGGRIR